jgi:hypothetical protein
MVVSYYLQALVCMMHISLKMRYEEGTPDHIQCFVEIILIRVMSIMAKKDYDLFVNDVVNDHI